MQLWSVLILSAAPMVGLAASQKATMPALVIRISSAAMSPPLLLLSPAVPLQAAMQCPRLASFSSCSSTAGTASSSTQAGQAASAAPSPSSAGAGHRSNDRARTRTRLCSFARHQLELRLAAPMSVHPPPPSRLQLATLSCGPALWRARCMVATRPRWRSTCCAPTRPASRR